MDEDLWAALKKEIELLRRQVALLGDTASSGGGGGKTDAFSPQEAGRTGERRRPGEPAAGAPRGCVCVRAGEPCARPAPLLVPGEAAVAFSRRHPTFLPIGPSSGTQPPACHPPSVRRNQLVPGADRTQGPLSRAPRLVPTGWATDDVRPRLRGKLLPGPDARSAASGNGAWKARSVSGGRLVGEGADGPTDARSAARAAAAVCLFVPFLWREERDLPARGRRSPAKFPSWRLRTCLYSSGRQRPCRGLQPRLCKEFRVGF
ncbi:uncharacterized protein LOC130682395 [Manis pentadactyla]|uniref:uncharacterized protein LOC130682395 n=1 Tax=Manis pentadactyla TaxID=143292 RepID=UPI00255CD1E5|nr:uncharacterized protein LOC130682395 [Manis pentadactyla]